jgi:hypothetical protein
MNSGANRGRSSCSVSALTARETDAEGCDRLSPSKRGRASKSSSTRGGDCLVRTDNNSQLA